MLLTCLLLFSELFFLTRLLLSLILQMFNEIVFFEYKFILLLINWHFVSLLVSCYDVLNWFLINAIRASKFKIFCFIYDLTTISCSYLCFFEFQLNKPYYFTGERAENIKELWTALTPFSSTEMDSPLYLNYACVVKF